MDHTCLICNHPDRDEIERKYLEGWRLIDIKRDHPFFSSVAVIIEHSKATGIYEEAKRSRRIKVKDICEDIIRAGLPNLDGKKIYPRDMLEAARILSQHKTGDDIEEFWALIKRKRAVPEEKENKVQKKVIKHDRIQTTKMAARLLVRIKRRKYERKKGISESSDPGNA